MQFIHFDEARQGARREVVQALPGMKAVQRALLVADLFGRMRLVLWTDSEEALGDTQEALSAKLSGVCGRWWTGEVYRVGDGGKVAESSRELRVGERAPRTR
jgi:hypothetical protein